jgi:hypothetical protein
VYKATLILEKENQLNSEKDGSRSGVEDLRYSPFNFLCAAHCPFLCGECFPFLVCVIDKLLKYIGEKKDQSECCMRHKRKNLIGWDVDDRNPINASITVLYKEKTNLKIPRKINK